MVCKESSKAALLRKMRSTMVRKKMRCIWLQMGTTKSWTLTTIFLQRKKRRSSILLSMNLAWKKKLEKTLTDLYFSACKRKDDSPDHPQQPKKPRLVFTDLQRRTLQAIFKVFRCFQHFFSMFYHIHLLPSQSMKPLIRSLFIL